MIEKERNDVLKFCLELYICLLQKCSFVIFMLTKFFFFIQNFKYTETNDDALLFVIIKTSGITQKSNFKSRRLNGILEPVYQ